MKNFVRPIVPIEVIAKAAVQIAEEHSELRKGGGISCSIAAARAFAAVAAYQTDMTEAEYQDGVRKLTLKQEFLALRVWQEIWYALCQKSISNEEQDRE